MSQGGFQVDLPALKQAAAAVQDAMGVLKSEVTMIGGKYLAEQGHGVSEMRLSSDVLGDDDLASDLEQFCRRWDYGVKYLMDEGKEMGSALDEVLGNYVGMDDHANNILKKVAHTLAGDPTKPVEEASDMSWGEIGQEAMPDFNLSREKAIDDMQQMGQAWEKALE